MSIVPIPVEDVPPVAVANDEVEAASGYEPQICEDSLQFLCMRWTTGSPECRGEARCELQDAAK